MKLLQCQSPGEVTAGILGRAGVEVPHVPTVCFGNVGMEWGGQSARTHAVRSRRETLIQIHPHPHIMAIIQNDTLKRTHWLH